MAGNSFRDVKLTVDVETLGEEGIRRLATDIRSIGKSAGDSAPQFEALAAEVDKLAAQQDAIASFKALSAAVEQAAAAQRDYLAIAATVGAEYADQAAKTDALVAAQKEAAVAVETARKAWADARDNLARFRAEASSAAKETASFAAEQQRLKIAVLDARAAFESAKGTLTEAKTATKEAAAVETDLAREHNAAAKAVVSSTGALRQRNAALVEAQSTASRLGVETNDVAVAERGLQQAVLGLAAAAAEGQRDLVALADAQAKAAEAAQLAERANIALNNIRKAAYEQDIAAKAAAEAAAEREAADAANLLAKAQTALNNIRKVAYEQDLAAKAKAEAAAEREAADAAQFAERAYTALNNIRRIAYQQDLAAKTRAEAEALDQLAQAAQRTAEALPNAFSQVGVRSIQAIQEEINRTQRALSLLQAGYEQGAVGAADFARATTAAQARMQALNAEISNVKGPATAIQQLNGLVLDLATSYGAVSAALATVGYAVKPIYDTVTQLESMRRVLTQVYGSVEAANQQIAFVDRVANNAGVSLNEAGKAYQTFAASAHSAGLSTDLVNQVFEATANAAGNLGLASDRTGLILLALSQMANKGTVTMEELRKQLGESLPGALNLMAQGLGITQPQLIKMVEAGQLLTSQALGPLAQAMAQLGAPGGHVDSTRASMQRLENAVTSITRSIADSSAWRGLGNAAQFVADHVDGLVTSMKFFIESIATAKIVTWASEWITLRAELAATRLGLDSAATSVTVLTEREVANTVAVEANTAATVTNTAAHAANAAAARGNAAAWGELAAGLGAVGPRMEQTVASTSIASRAFGALGSAGRAALGIIGGFPGLLVGVALNARELGTTIGETVAKWAGWGDVADANNKKIAEWEAQAKAAAEANQKVGDSWIKATVAYNDALGPIEKNIEAAQKHVKAAKEQADATQTLARLTGSESEALNAAASAAHAQAQAASDLALAKQRQADLTSNLVASLEAQVASQGRLTAAEEKQLTTLQSKLVVERAAADEAAAAAEKERVAATAAEEAAFKQRDNAKSVDELRIAYEGARQIVTDMALAYARGEVGLTTYNSAVEVAAKLQGRYRDALKDSNAELERQLTQIGRDASLKQGALGVEEAYWRSSEQIAKSLGDETGAISANINQRDIQVAKLKVSIQARLDEAAALDQEVAKMREEAALLTGDALNSKLTEIKARQDAATAKRQEAAAGQEAIRGIEAETDALRNYIAVASQAASVGGNLSTAFEARDAQGHTAADRAFLQGQTGPVDNSYIFTLRERMQRGETFAASEIPAITNALKVARSNATLGASNPAAVSLAGQRDMEGWVVTLQRVLELAQQSAARDKLRGATPATTPTTTVNTPTPTVADTVGKVITLKFGSQSTTVNLASSADAANLEAFLSQLETASTRSGG